MHATWYEDEVKTMTRRGQSIARMSCKGLLDCKNMGRLHMTLCLRDHVISALQFSKKEDL